MSRALAVFHGRFGRATVYQLNRPFNVHAHREGHLIFHVGGTPAQIDVCDQRWLLEEDSIVAVNPWEPHNFVPTDLENGAIFFVLYVNAEWFAPNAASALGLRFGRTHFYRLFRTQTGVTPHLYLNTLIMENALDALVTTEAPVAGIGYDLGFSSQSAFTRFFAANVGMPPTDYRRAAKVLRP